MIETVQPAVPTWFWGITVFVLGACWGSFLNVCIWRMPRDQSVIRPPSHCGSCDTPIAWFDNIPLLSYFLLGGKCRKCGAKFSFRYWLVEFINAALWLMIWREFSTGRGWGVVIAYCILLSMLLVGTFVDFEFYIIPDRITLGLVVVGFIFSLTVPELHPRPSWVDWDFFREHAPALSNLPPRLHAVLNSILGIIAGGGSLWLIVEMGKLAFGRLKLPLEPGTQVGIEPTKLKLPDQEIPYEEVFYRDSDRIRFHAAKLKMGEQSFENVDVSISPSHLEVGGQKFALDDIRDATGTTALLVIPREAMGFGDVKLMAGIGAFVGWTPIFFILMTSALLGSVVGLALVVLHMRELQGRIPYGPYIALAAVIWLFFGPDILNWYWSLSEARIPS
jgi:leader peptidase (prepilin peptidase)/N-methyltransferase